MFVVALAISVSLPPASALAVSDYDELLQTTSSPYVYTDGSTQEQKMSIGSTWWAEFKQTYAKRILQGGSGWPTNFVTEFDDIVDEGGSWGVIQKVTNDGNMLTIIGSRDPSADCGFYGTAGSGGYTCTSNSGYGFVRAEYFTHNSFGSNGCGTWPGTCTDTGMNIYTAPIVQTGTAGYEIFYLPNYALSWHKFFFMNFDMTYPSGYEGELIAADPPAAKYVAMGDSFSSGEGNPPFEAGTDESGVNECHRSPKAWPRLLQFDLELGSTAFVACSGATTANVLNGGQLGDEPAQIDALSSDTDVVTITIGGNDVGFKAFAEKCVSPLNPPFEDVCDEYTEIYDDVTGEIAGSLPEKLEEVYTELLNSAPNAEIYVVGYPIVAPYKSISDPFDGDCGGLYDAWPNTWGDARAAYEVTNLLNTSIEDAASTVNTQESSARLHYVDSASGAFVGHDICSSDSYFNGINTPPNMSYSLHPNSDGHIALKEDVSDYLN